MKINLVQGGIFPILGKTKKDSTGFVTAGTFQGEGKLTGTACLFIRTSGCNLRCAWKGLDGKGSLCDTPYSSHAPEKNQMNIEDIVKIVKENTTSQNIKHVVLSGGEPFLQYKAIGPLLKRLKEEGYHTTVETNATIYDELSAENTDLMSMSPKLSTSTPWEDNLKGTSATYSEKWAIKHEKVRRNIEVMQSFIDSSKKNNTDFQLKFVVSSENDIKEIEDILEELTGYEPSDVMLMPEGVDVDTLNKRTGWIAEQALLRGWRFAPRLHIMMFGKNRYV